MVREVVTKGEGEEEEKREKKRDDEAHNRNSILPR